MSVLTMNMSNIALTSSSYRLNSQLSDGSFKKSCETIRAKIKRFDSRYLNSILVHDDPEKAFIQDDDHLYVWYFAIGSMINPISLYLRDLTPLMSYPARCPDHHLVFRDRCGMADIEECPDDEFDGVVHLLPIEQMLRLDQVEHMYQRITIDIIDYQERVHCVNVYKMTLIDDKERPKSLPTERYLDIIVKGCEYFGVRSTYVNRLKYEQAVIPRKSSSEYRTIKNIPDHIFFTTEQLLEHDGRNHDLPIWISINGKILEYTGLPIDDDPDYDHQKRFYDFVSNYFAGKEVVHAISKAWYEPMYKVALDENDLSYDHCALAEDMCASWGLNNCGDQGRSYWKPIGRLQQTECKLSS